jgi:hypothetical protein
MENNRLSRLSSLRVLPFSTSGRIINPRSRRQDANQDHSSPEDGVDHLATGRDMLWSPTIRASLVAGDAWLTEPAWHAVLQILDP